MNKADVCNLLERLAEENKRLEELLIMADVSTQDNLNLVHYKTLYIERKEEIYSIINYMIETSQENKECVDFTDMNTLQKKLEVDNSYIMDFLRNNKAADKKIAIINAHEEKYQRNVKEILERISNILQISAGEKKGTICISWDVYTIATQQLLSSYFPKKK